MKAIQMVDLKSQYEKIKPEINAAIQEVIDSCAFIKGQKVKDFEAHLADYLHVKHVISCGNGTDALQISMMALGLQPGDEVITSPFTFIATAEVIALLKLTPVFVDVNLDTFNLDVSQVENAITSRTKAIVPVHLFGQCCDMEPLLLLAEKYQLYVVEDACQAIGAEYHFSNGTSKKAGTMGHIGCTSFFPSKNLGCYGDGGAIFTDDDNLAHTLRGIVNHGMFTRYYHDMIGVNSRLDTLQAAILDIKLAHLDEYISNRQSTAERYSMSLSHCAKLVIPAVSSFGTHVFHQYTLKLEGVNRAQLVAKMKEDGIPVMIYYPMPLHLQKAFSYLNKNEGAFPVAESLCNSVISLPMHTELDDEQIAYIVRQLLQNIR